MAVTLNRTAVVTAGSTLLRLSDLVDVTPATTNPTYLIVTGLDRNEYTVGATGATASFVGNGHTLSMNTADGDGRVGGIAFTYQPSTGLYYNTTYGYLNNLTIQSSGSLNDLADISVFGTNSASVAAYASDSYAMMQVDPSGYVGTISIANQPAFSAAVPAQATASSIAATAISFVGKTWNLDGCWVLASTIATEAGAALPVVSTAIGVAGQPNGEWIVAFNGPAGASGNWQSQVTAGEIVVIGGPAVGHITTIVSGAGSTAMVVDNATFVNASGTVTNSAHDGSANDIVIQGPHLASGEWGGVTTADVVIYELDAPIVTDRLATDSLATGASGALAALFSGVNPGPQAITKWQIYDSATADAFVINGVTASAHSAATAVSVASLSAASLLAGASAGTDTVDARAFNGLYWGDWQTMTVAITRAAPVLATQTAAQSWVEGHAFSLALPAATFTDATALTYSATTASGQALPSWLTFNPTTRIFSGTAPATAQTLSLAVKATDSAGLSASETISVSIVPEISLRTQTAAQSWTAGQAVGVIVPASAFTDNAGAPMTFMAAETTGLNVTSWLSFNPHTGELVGTVPAAAHGAFGLDIIASDASGMTATDFFTVSIAPAPGHAASTTPFASVSTLTPLPTTSMSLPLTHGA